MYTLRQSVGDLSPPGYPQWTDLIKTHYYGANTMIFLVWSTFLTNLYMMVVVLLNFLIAVISQVYEET